GCPGGGGSADRVRLGRLPADRAQSRVQRHRKTRTDLDGSAVAVRPSCRPGRGRVDAAHRRVPRHPRTVTAADRARAVLAVQGASPLTLQPLIGGGVAVPWDPDSGQTFGEYVRSKGVQVRPGGWTWTTRDQVTEGRNPAGERFKTVTDQLGNEVTERTDAKGRQRKDVNIILR